ncbi:hypothetical protein ACFVYA_29445 [Amycolatopsis sp. NPDC058278]|uniref:hypothetical protein n=1 Tax=unclassified Amycolatopsis TaxID=2618356 RepID=UPI00255BBEDF|nr:hypothetical protein [Amycolatopsis sp. DG1A-15b]WIX85585.1 hypothetical protein QRY02_30720 [Amycolatopsis sp. DG1A-15b]
MAAVLLLGGLLAGCQVAVAGTAGVSAADQATADRRAEERAAVDAALTALGQAPAIALKSTVQGAEQQFRITRGGYAIGGLPLDGRFIQVTAAAAQFYLQADADYWKAHAIDEGTQFGTSWVRSLGSELPFDPAARLTPPALAAGLRKALTGLDRPSEPVKAKLPDGTEVYQLGAAPSVLRVTTAKPNRVVSFAPALLDPQAGPKYGAEFGVAALTGDAVKTFHTDFDAAVGGLGQPFEGLVQASALVTNDHLDCKDFVGSCTTTVDVSNSVVGTPASGEKSVIHITLSVEVSAESLGAQTCTAAGDAEPYKTIQLSCGVKFKLPNRTASYQVLSKPTATAEVRAGLDVDAVKQKVAAEFAGLGG